jgi:hypothetical protein
MQARFEDSSGLIDWETLEARVGTLSCLGAILLP